MPSMDQYLPDYQFSETHARDIPATPGQVMDAVIAFQPEQDPFFRRMIALREIPARLMAKLTGRIATAPFGLANFTRIAQSDSAVMYGLIGQFWQSDYGLVPFESAAAFSDFAEPGVAKLLLGFIVEPLPGGYTRLTTQTRVFCPDKAARLKFGPYWYVIRPVSGLIRQRILAGIATQCRLQG